MPCQGSTAYAIYQTAPYSKPPATWYFGKVTTAQLKAKTGGTLLFKIPPSSFRNLAVVP
jgi:hypothetical protein